MIELRRVCVFAGSSPGTRPEYAEAADLLGRTLAKRDVGVVYGGGRVGLMGAVADAALDAGGTVTGVIPEHLVTREIAHDHVTDLRIVATMHERKALMAELSDAFIVLPGGLGTLEEAFEVLSWTQLGLYSKPTAFLDVGGYFTPLTALLDHAVSQGFVRPEHRALAMIETDVETLLERIRTFEMPRVERWLDRDET